MNTALFNTPLGFSRAQITDGFFGRVTELVRTQVIPYQWEAINDRVSGAAPSWCMHNFRAAARLNRERRENAAFVEPAYTFRGFEALPEDPQHPDPDRFYGYVFQDSDFAKWIEAVAYSLAQHPDPALEQTADEAIDLVVSAQLEDGYLDTYYIINGMDAAWSNLRDNHELYCFGHLAEAAAAYYQATGKDKLLRAACRFADCIGRHFGPGEGQCKGYPGHEVAEMALVRLYEATGEKRYLDLSCYFINQRGQEPKYFVEEEKARRAKEGQPVRPTNLSYHQSECPVRQMKEANGHAVRAGYLYAGMADVSRLTEDEELLWACERLWRSIVDEKLYITGGMGGTHMGEAFSYPFDLPGDTAYSETCAAISLVFFARRMLQIAPKSEYADVMEQALYNTVLAGMALDGKSFFYVNPLTVVPQALSRDERLAHVKPERQKWFGCACCPPNIARMATSVSQYAWTESEEVLFTHLYVGGTVRKDFQGRTLTMSLSSGVPWQGHAQARVHVASPVEATLAFRLPAWSDAPCVSAKGKTVSARDGYAYVSGLWRDGEEIEIELPMPVRMWTADERVRELAGCVAFTRGPITYCAEEADNGKDLHLLLADGLSAAAVKDETFGHSTIRLAVSGARIIPRQGGLYRPVQKLQTRPETIQLIPYYAWANRGIGEMRVWLRHMP